MDILTIGRIVQWWGGTMWRAAICVYVDHERHEAELYVPPACGDEAHQIFVDTRAASGHLGIHNTWRWPPREA